MKNSEVGNLKCEKGVRRAVSNDILRFSNLSMELEV